MLKLWIRKLSAVINRTASRRALDGSLKMLDLLNSMQRCRDLLSNNNAFTSSHGQVVNECVDDLDIEYIARMIAL